LGFLSIPDHAGDKSPRRLAPEKNGLAAEIRETAFSPIAAGGLPPSGNTKAPQERMFRVRRFMERRS